MMSAFSVTYPLSAQHSTLPTLR